MDSRGIVSAGYDDLSNTLEIKFPGGAVYQYLRVPEPLYRDLLAAESKGRFVNLYIKPYFESREIDSNEPVIYIDSSKTAARAGARRAARRSSKRGAHSRGRR